MTAIPTTLNSPRSGAGRRDPFSLLISAELWKDVAFHLLSFVLGLFWFVTLVTLIAVGGALSITLVGIPILAASMVLVKWGARFERGRVALMLDQPIADPYRPLPDGTLGDKAKALAKDPAVWRDLLYLLLLFPLGVIAFVVTIVALVLPLGIFIPLTYWLGFTNTTADFMDPWLAAWLTALLGLLALVAFPYIQIGMARAHAAIAHWLLAPSRQVELQERVDTLASSRSRMVDASHEERRRIERDLHDGAQQRLVALAIDLGMAREKLASDPEAARALVDEAHEEAKHALAEIRSIVRGIHPAILTDRGLDAAISALAGRCPVPVSVEVNLSERPPEPVETTAYYVVAEALTNIAKHSGAGEAWVVIQRTGDRLSVDVIDDGQGGADPELGTGVRGLIDRVNALDGTLELSSPPGGPTRLHAELPCG